MNLFEFEGKCPVVHPTAFIAPTATLIGDVRVAAGASVWYGAVLRGDISPIIVREDANIQDNSVLHGVPDMLTEIGPGATVAHGCLVHGAILGAECILGNMSSVLDGAKIGAGSLIAAHSLVPAGFDVPPGVLASGAPMRVRRPIEGTDFEAWIKINPGYYADLARRHRKGVVAVPGTAVD
ncbi:gamma carbonic anhydrase family protein [Nocardia brasiliensis]|uniref:gamma carbonic anhydrase family protein n=1 Tax=Nocardia brasiliensis TaxID=37326 RepID=UPI0004A76257|nr:gamma carbonic anhydrase family protein [Nocardia brasiliensis]MBF6542590.1 gamma carbonic anhydrase family protein [Nocardia brasiliensis]